jgi:hypothetical protein
MGGGEDMEGELNVTFDADGVKARCKMFHADRNSRLVVLGTVCSALEISPEDMLLFAFMYPTMPQPDHSEKVEMPYWFKPNGGNNNEG